MLEINKVHNMSCLEGMKLLDNNSVDAVVTDPPYELGFMGKHWDASGIAYNIELWKQVLRVLKPGGHLLSFGGTRTFHRMACAIEDAGFQIRDTIMWVYSTGFPKSLNIGKAVDKLQGNERETVGCGECGYNVSISKIRKEQGYRPNLTNTPREFDLTKGTSEWEGWGTALKPSVEPIVMARKPLSEKTVAENCLKWGTGGLNIDACRVPYKSDKDFEDRKRGNLKSNPLGRNGVYSEMDTINTDEYINKSGRFPANLIHDGSEEVVGLFPNSKGMSGGGAKDKLKQESWVIQPFNRQLVRDEWIRSDSGSASRFFYCAKASKSERNRGCDGLDEKNNRKLMGNANNTAEHASKGFERFETQPSKNNHPTVKPISLMRYLVRLVTPKGGLVLDPFIGSGTTGIGARLEGMDFLGFEQDKEYCDIAVARLKKYVEQNRLEDWGLI
jgi:DNA modification methylase